MPRHVITPEARQLGLLKRKRAKDAQTLATLHLAGGWTLYPDTDPGVGWVLAPPGRTKEGALVPGAGHRLKYFRDREQALSMHPVYLAQGETAEV